MRKLVLTAFLAAGMAAPVVAQQQQQQLWQPEIGIKAGFAHADITDTDIGVNFIDLPGVGGISAAGLIITPAPLYGIIPIGRAMAIEPSFGFQNFAAGGSPTTALTLGARFNYAFNPRFYFGVGPTMYLYKTSGLEDTQGALQVAVGYRRPLGTSFNFLAEGFYEVREKSEALAGADLYGVRIGAGAILSGKAAAAPAGPADRMWTSAIGIQGGWSLVSVSGAVDAVFLTAPFMGQSLGVPGPSALFMLFPVGKRLAIEPSFDLHSVKVDEADATTLYEVGAKLNYAFNRKLYAGAGVEYSGASVDGIDDGSSVAIVLATGLRFPIAGPVQGRTELGYRMYDGSDLAGAGQVTSFSFGIMVPVK